MILITGTSGYIGGVLAQSLKKEKYDVRSACHKTSDRKENFFELNMQNIEQIEKSCKGVDTIIHLASLNHAQSEARSAEAFQINFEGTKNLFNYALKNNVKKFIYFSTAHVYGKNLINKVDEFTEINPISNYSFTHYLAEQYCYSKSKNEKIQTFVLRISNIIGPPINMDVKNWYLVCNDLCLQAIKNKMIILRTDGKQKRDFFPIENLIHTINNIIEDKSLVKSRYIFNLGTGISISVLELAEIIKKEYEELFNHRIKIICGSKTENITELTYSTEKINSSGLYYRRCQIKESIRNTLIFCRDNYL
tara:strand:+ start:2231 stop:3151 length:921 start_codon:yes stop_codon:yes gene_type:complete